MLVEVGGRVEGGGQDQDQEVVEEVKVEEVKVEEVEVDEGEEGPDNLWNATSRFHTYAVALKCNWMKCR